LAAIGDDQRGQDAQERALARAVGAHHAVDGAVVHRHGRPPQCVDGFFRTPWQPASDVEPLHEPDRLDGWDAGTSVSHIYARVVPALRLHIRSAALLAATRLVLRRRGTTGTLRALTRRPARRGEVQPQKALRAVRRAGRVVGGSCLAQSVALAAVLEGAERHPTLILGARREAGQSWSAHAWV